MQYALVFGKRGLAHEGSDTFCRGSSGVDLRERFNRELGTGYNAYILEALVLCLIEGQLSDDPWPPPPGIFSGGYSFSTAVLRIIQVVLLDRATATTRKVFCWMLQVSANGSICCNSVRRGLGEPLGGHVERAAVAVVVVGSHCEFHREDSRANFSRAEIRTRLMRDS